MGTVSKAIGFVACLRSLQLSPQVLLLDEPTASLDSTATQQLEALIAQWRQDASVNRTRRRFPGVYWNSVVSILAASAFVTGLLVEGIIHIHPWYDPQYVIPLLGMVLGNALTATSLALDRLMEDLVSRRSQIESLLALEATRWEAANDTLKEALRTGMIPTINSMMVLGLVSLPGMMTGQMLAGGESDQRLRYQIAIYSPWRQAPPWRVWGLFCWPFGFCLAQSISCV